MDKAIKYYKCNYADERCKYRGKDGWCKHKRVYCDGNGNVPFDDKVTVIENKEICQNSSIFGNYYISVTDKQINALINNGVLALTGEEYNIFIKKEES